MPKRSQRIYVERVIHGDIETIWERTQTPALHERWDVRFSRIEYLPRPDETQPQQFLYATRIGFGLEIAGGGETSGNREGAGGTRTSALRFWSDDPKSLIRTGSGYWQYVPTTNGVRFLTAYDYEVRFGAAGRAFDALVFRPLMGWATAYGFDRLRLWIERGVDPARSLRRGGIVAAAWAGAGIAAFALRRRPLLAGLVAGAFAFAALRAGEDAPWAGRCLRQPPTAPKENDR